MQQDARLDVLQAIKEAHGKVIKRVHEDVIARLPTSGEQELLKIVRNTPVLEVKRTNYAEDDDTTVIMFNRLIFVASYFELSYDYITPLWTGKS
jgi:DNA-binding GntR family transcriptional regulator